MLANGETQDVEFVMSRVLDVPRELVWKMFTQTEHLVQWWGPKGFKVLSCKLDLRPGGTYHYGMQTPNGQTMWGKFEYREVAAPERLVFVNYFSDEAGGITRHPMARNWPLRMLSTFTFEAEPAGKTRFTVRWQTLDATAEEQKTFDEGRNSMRAGWGGTMDQLETYLAKTR